MPEFSKFIRPNLLWHQFESAVVNTIASEMSLVVEPHSPDIAVSPTLTQDRWPAAFFSRVPTKIERHHSSVRKEASAIVEVVPKSRHDQLGTHLRLVTSQKPVAFIYDSGQHRKIKNNEFQRWIIGPSGYIFGVICRLRGGRRAISKHLIGDYVSGVTERTAQFFVPSECRLRAFLWETKTFYNLSMMWNLLPVISQFVQI